MKIGGASYVEVGEGVVAEREVVRIVAAAPAEIVQPSREIVTLVAPVDTRHFDEMSSRALTELKTLNCRILAVTEALSRVQTAQDANNAVLAEIQTSITENWLYRLVSWIGRLF